MSPNLIGPELDNTGKLAKDKIVHEEKETEETKVDNVEEGWASINSIKEKDTIINAYIDSIKKKDNTVNKIDH